MRKLLLAFGVLSLGLSACQIVINEGDDDDDPCPTGGLEAPPLDLRDPETGVCSAYGGGGGGGGGCGTPDNGSGDQAAPATPDWAMCNGFCEGLDPWSCMAADGCRVAELTIYGEDGTVTLTRECWGTAPSGPIHGECRGLDAYQCSLHDDCIAHYDGSRGSQRFSWCGDEGICDDPADPLPPEELRDPYSGLCVAVGGGGGGCGVPLPGASEGSPGDGPTTGEGGGTSEGGTGGGDGGEAAPPLLDWATCGACANYDEATCLVADGCRAIYVDDGNDDLQPGPFIGCWGTAPITGPVVGGGCAGLDAYECSRHSDCSAVYGQDETGFAYCLPEGAVPPPVPACSEVADEVTCIDLTDGCLESGACNEACAPVYQGSDCACTPAGCSCNDWAFQSCVSAGWAGDAFACGTGMCSSAQACLAWTGGAQNMVSYECVDLPGDCADPTIGDACGCIDAAPGCACATDAAGNVQIRCSAP